MPLSVFVTGWSFCPDFDHKRLEKFGECSLWATFIYLTSCISSTNPQRVRHNWATELNRTLKIIAEGICDYYSRLRPKESKLLRLSNLLKLSHLWFPLMAQCVKNLPAMQETQEKPIQSLGCEDPVEEENGNWLQYSCLEKKKSHGQRSLAEYSPKGPKESDTTEWLSKQASKQAHSYTRGWDSNSGKPPTGHELPNQERTGHL